MKTTSIQIQTKTDKPEERDLLNRLHDNLIASETSLWNVGDCVNELKREYDWTTTELADLFRQSRVRLDELAKTARDIPQDERWPHLTFSAHEVARQSSQRTQHAIQRELGEEIESPLEEALDIVEKQAAPTSKAAAGREVTKALIGTQSLGSSPTLPCGTTESIR